MLLRLSKAATLPRYLTAALDVTETRRHARMQEQAGPKLKQDKSPLHA